jgi:hypothetical protein
MLLWLRCASFQVHRVLIAFVKTQISESEEAYPNNPKLLMMPDQIQVHHVAYQLGSAKELCVPASTINATSLLTPTCITEVGMSSLCCGSSLLLAVTCRFTDHVIQPWIKE